MVTIPGYEDLSETQQEAIRIRLVYGHTPYLPGLLSSRTDLQRPTAKRIGEESSSRYSCIAFSSYVSARACPVSENADRRYLSALSDRSDTPITLPPDPPEVVLQEDISLETQSRQTLEEDGCVPCYPVGLEIPLPEQVGPYQGVVTYFKVHGRFGRCVLSSQLCDWKNFRNFQAKNRRYFVPRNTFVAFQEKVRDRRRRHKLEGDASLHPDLKQQRRLDDWIEYQDYHLLVREDLERMIKNDEEKLASVQEEAGGKSSPGSTALYNLRVFPYRINRDTSKRKRHEGLLQWIEQQRLAMVAEEGGDKIATTDHHDRGWDTRSSVRKVSPPENRTKKPKAVSVLGPVRSRISKTVPQDRNLRPRKRDTIRTADRAATTESSIPQDLSSQSRLHTNERPGSIAIPPSYQSPLHRVAKAGKLPKNKHSNGLQPIEQSAPIVNRTRSGRISKKPNEFGFG
ncbi:MAG: hypothetical protein Q9211_001557 [Gyalolechia sp. 1 TL-2023]